MSSDHDKPPVSEARPTAKATVALRLLRRLAIAFAACLLIFSGLKLAAVQIPEGAIHQSLVESSRILDDEGGDYRFLIGREKTTQIDNFTTAIMLKVCASSHSSGLSAAFGDFHYVDEALESNRQTGSLREQLSGGVPDDDPGWRAYARYWHGYVAILKPLLVFLNLDEMRMLFVIVSGLLLVADVCLMARQRGVLAGLALGLPFFAVNYQVAVVSPSLAFTFLIALVGTLAVLLRVRCGGGASTPPPGGSRSSRWGQPPRSWIFSAPRF